MSLCQLCLCGFLSGSERDNIAHGSKKLYRQFMPLHRYSLCVCLLFCIWYTGFDLGFTREPNVNCETTTNEHLKNLCTFYLATNGTYRFTVQKICWKMYMSMSTSTSMRSVRTLLSHDMYRVTITICHLQIPNIIIWPISFSNIRQLSASFIVIVLAFVSLLLLRFVRFCFHSKNPFEFDMLVFCDCCSCCCCSLAISFRYFLVSFVCHFH